MRKYAIHCLVCVIAALLLAACSKMDKTFKDYVVPGGVTYTGKVTNVQVFSGRERIKLAWIRGTDPNVTKAIIYWNNNADSAVVPIKQGTPQDTISVLIDKLKEGTYNFSIYTADDFGHRSIRVDAQGRSCGAGYQSSLLIRPLATSTPIAKDALLSFMAADTSSVTEVNYTDENNKAQTVYLSHKQDKIQLLNVKPGSAYTFRSVFLPSKPALDSFYTDFATGVIPANLAIGKTITASSEVAGSIAANLIDRDLTSFWAPTAADRTDDKKVSVTIDLKTAQTFNQVKQYWRKGSEFIASYKIQGSDNGTTWKDLFSKTTGPGSTEDVTFQAATNRYVRIEFTIGTTDGEVNINEIEIYKN